MWKQNKEINNLFKNRNFRLLWSGELVSLLGDQFTLTALPWLVFQLTGDSVAMGTVLALAGVPRALFMLLGGAITDRLSPRTSLIMSNLSRSVFVGSLAVFLLTGQIQMWMVYIFALLFGLADAFYYPAIGAIVPMVVPLKSLETGNMLIQGTARLSVFLGPVLAGGLIALFSNSGATSIADAPGMTGIGLSFGIDALTFIVSVTTLWMMNMKLAEGDQKQTGERVSVLASIWNGLTYVWKDKPMRNFFIMIAGMHLFATGPVFVGVPVLAATRYSGGAASLGMVMSAFGGGNLLGIVLAGMLPNPRRTGAAIFVAITIAAATLGLMGFAPSQTTAALIALVMGAAEGYILILFTTFLQTRTERSMLGRTISLLNLCSVGLVPISNAVSGALIKLSPEGLFGGASLFMLLIIAMTVRNPEVRQLVSEKEGDQPKQERQFGMFRH